MKPLKKLHNPFTEHPASVDETYLQHMMIAMDFAGQLFYAAGILVMHAVFPFLFKTTASDKISELAGMMKARDKK
jgi:hypothetical protein